MKNVEDENKIEREEFNNNLIGAVEKAKKDPRDKMTINANLNKERKYNLDIILIIGFIIVGGLSLYLAIDGKLVLFYGLSIFVAIFSVFLIKNIIISKKIVKTIKNGNYTTIRELMKVMNKKNKPLFLTQIADCISRGYLINVKIDKGEDIIYINKDSDNAKL